MAMDFWEAQRRARLRTAFYLALFVVLTLLAAVCAELVLRYVAGDNYEPPLPLLGFGFLAVTFAVAAYNYLMYKQHGGGYVAESMGAYPISADTRDFHEKQLYNIVHEMAIATSLPMPEVYLIPSEEINAFAAGLNPKNAAIAITEGAMERLNRDEIQGVIAHEFGHIKNADMVISLRLAAMVMGFFFALYIGLRIMQLSQFRSRDSNGRGNGGHIMILAALIIIVAGALTWFFGTILKATVSRQREYLADASAVQFTRNPDGIANALRKIAKDQYHDMPKTGAAYSHLYLEDRSSIFATHPPIEKRIAAIEGHQYEEKPND